MYVCISVYGYTHKHEATRWKLLIRQAHADCNSPFCVRILIYIYNCLKSWFWYSYQLSLSKMALVKCKGFPKSDRTVAQICLEDRPASSI